MKTKQDVMTWYQRVTSVARSNDAEIAYRQIIDVIVPVMIQQGIPHEFVYDDISDTTNLTMPASIAANILQLLKDAGFLEMDIPQKDVQASAEMLEAMRAGADFQKKWS